MIVEEISLEHWRGFGRKHTFSFDSGLNLLAGENEAGKSTIFEALWRVIFDRHNSTASEIRDMQPEGTTLAPSSSIVFVQSGRRYRLVKRFLGRPLSELWEEHNGAFSLIHEGDMADSRAIEIVGGAGTSKGASKEHHRGLAHALWYLQMEQPLPDNAWNAAIGNGIGGVVQKITSTPKEEEVMRLVEEDYQGAFTPTGKVKVSSDLAAAQHRSAEIESELNVLRERISSAEGTRNSIEALLPRLSEANASYDAAEREIERLAIEVRANEGLVSQINELASRLELKESELSSLEKLFSDITKRNSEMERFRQELEAIIEETSSTEVDLRTAAKTRLRSQEQWHLELEPRLKNAESLLAKLLALERLRKLEKDESRLGIDIGRRKELADIIRLKREGLSRLNAPDEIEWSQLGMKETELRVAEAEVRASSIHVSFRLEDPEARITPNPKVDPEGNEYSIAGPTTFQIDGVGEVVVKGGGKSLEDARASAEKARLEVEKILRKYSAESTGALSLLVEERRGAESAVSDAEREIARIDQQHPDAEEEYRRVQDGIQSERAKAGDTAVQYSGLGGQKIREMARELEAKKAELISLIQSAQKEEREAADRESSLLNARAALGSRLADTKARIGVLGEENMRALSQFGSLKLLEDKLNALRQAVDEEHRKLDALRFDHSSRVRGLNEKLADAESARKETGERRAMLNRSLIEMRARIEAASGENTYSRIADLEAEGEHIANRMKTLARRAKGLKLLRETLLMRRQALSSELTGPVTELVSRWFDEITGGRYEVVEMDSNLLPRGVRKTGGSSISLRNLSHGTQEQVVVLVRLALGVLASGEERNLVVLDDRLVNADPERLGRLASVLQEASMKCQILLATCNQLSYTGVRARMIQVPEDGIGRNTTS